MGIETVFLDAGGVLVFPNWSFVSAVLAEHGIPVDARSLFAADYVGKRELDAGSDIQSSSANEQWARHFDLVLTHAGVELNPTTREVFRRVCEYDDAHNLWEVVPQDVIPALARMRSLGLRLVVVSNSNGTLAAMFERLSLASHVDLLIDSHRDGVRKPDPRLFHIALQRAGAQAHPRSISAICSMLMLRVRAQRGSAPCCSTLPTCTRHMTAGASAR